MHVLAAEIADDLFRQPSAVTDLIELAIRAREHAERLAPDPAAAKLVTFADGLMARAELEMDLAATAPAVTPKSCLTE